MPCLIISLTELIAGFITEYVAKWVIEVVSELFAQLIAIIRNTLVPTPA